MGHHISTVRAAHTASPAISSGLKQNKAKTAPRQSQAPARDFDKEARGKVRHGLVCAMIEAGKQYADIVKALPAYTKLVMEDDKPASAPDPAPTQAEDVINVDDIPF